MTTEHIDAPLPGETGDYFPPSALAPPVACDPADDVREHPNPFASCAFRLPEPWAIVSTLDEECLRA